MPQRPAVTGNTKVGKRILRVVPALLARAEEAVSRELTLCLRQVNDNCGNVLGNNLPEDTKGSRITREHGDPRLTGSADIFAFLFF